MVFWTRVRFPPAPLFSDYRSQNFCFCVISVRVQLVKIFQSFRTFLKIWPRPLSRPNRLTSYIYRYLSTSVLSGSYMSQTVHWLQNTLFYSKSCPITVPPSTVISLTFREFHLQNSLKLRKIYKTPVIQLTINPFHSFH